MTRLLKVLVVAVLLIAVTGVYFTLSTPTHLFRFSGSFNDCPPRPSCVSSAATDPVHAIAPLSYRGEPQTVADRLEQLINAHPQGEVVYREPDYLHAVYVSPTMRYHDDLELLIQPDGVIQVRSISRFGYRDFDVNRNRVEALRQALAAAAAPDPASP